MKNVWLKLQYIIVHKIFWRRGWDLNPRGPEGPLDLESSAFPLCHPLPTPLIFRLAAGFLFPGSIMKDSAASKNFSVDFRVSGIGV